MVKQNALKKSDSGAAAAVRSAEERFILVWRQLPGAVDLNLTDQSCCQSPCLLCLSRERQQLQGSFDRKDTGVGVLKEFWL